MHVLRRDWIWRVGAQHPAIGRWNAEQLRVGGMVARALYDAALDAVPSPSTTSYLQGVVSVRLPANARPRPASPVGLPAHLPLTPACTDTHSAVMLREPTIHYCVHVLGHQACLRFTQIWRSCPL